jgi:hypothetical protein
MPDISPTMRSDDAAIHGIVIRPITVDNSNERH